LTFSGQPHPGEKGFSSAAGSAKRNNRYGVDNRICSKWRFRLFGPPQEMSIQKQIVWSLPFPQTLGCVI
jgi:hypothetical protein